MAIITTLCGSTKFEDAFIDANKKLTLEGKIVLTVGFFEHLEESLCQKNSLNF
jgi:hypothetical protein